MIDIIKNVGVIGLGVMGFDIAFLYEQKGYRTPVYDAAEAAMKNLPSRRDRTIERLKKRNRISGAEADNYPRSSILLAALAKSNPLLRRAQTNPVIYNLSETRGDGLDPPIPC